MIVRLAGLLTACPLKTSCTLPWPASLVLSIVHVPEQPRVVLESSIVAPLKVPVSVLELPSTLTASLLGKVETPSIVQPACAALAATAVRARQANSARIIFLSLMGSLLVQGPCGPVRREVPPGGRSFNRPLYRFHNLGGDAGALTLPRGDPFRGGPRTLVALPMSEGPVCVNICTASPWGWGFNATSLQEDPDRRRARNYSCSRSVVAELLTCIRATKLVGHQAGEEKVYFGIGAEIQIGAECFLLAGAEAQCLR